MASRSTERQAERGRPRGYGEARACQVHAELLSDARRRVDLERAVVDLHVPRGQLVRLHLGNQSTDAFDRGRGLEVDSFIIGKLVVRRSRSQPPPGVGELRRSAPLVPAAPRVWFPTGPSDPMESPPSACFDEHSLERGADREPPDLP